MAAGISTRKRGRVFHGPCGRTFRIGSPYDPVPDGGAQPVFGLAPPSYSGAKSDDGHVYVGGFSVRMNPDGTNVEIIGLNFRNSYEQTVTSFGDVFHNDNDDPPACRTSFLMEYGNSGFFRATANAFGTRTDAPANRADRRMASGRSRHDSVRRRLRRRRAHRHRVQRR